ncbi:transcriptional regulator, TraR/DksA family [Schinkia azotoformans MEV2011]|uniref:Transcriptional regulator, TraR/DksA family n=1 Tax=Schinkia azotoformans MEV2011 TaxID=1348973 RepID=A0A072NWD2_SCHAZ|nr:TraR/DksA C4-type zinc finger protein [Schinkia azotoformans]KEF37550.1 transcriptional regulator, TraR/DksA family [Schinkia azotoformans MEV2011]MEC1695276.1 TraR/DksA C4-type zinc finger protein [Schinkia azotoformans]MEC1717924.1 TraR/DksA C4-type zinc finger protein [Schinkia azotoformans]MEC1724700.1 TraR/DksA C4-type zinc finger protein [Schinkia azotoformans]MEC1741043.1 TraR/DksA C4-type zinc finger protein [Schinkia azotoformans]
MLTPNELSSIKAELQERKKEISEGLEATDYFDTERAQVHDSIGELSNYDNHPGDHGTELFERGKDIALVEHAEKEIKDINHVLANIEKGTYGKCEECGKDIPVDRLKALPTATHCIEHTPDNVVSHQRPVEEDILKPPYGQFEYDEKDATFYDAEDSWQDVGRYGTSETPSDFFDQSMLDYNDMYVEEDENVGYVEDIESFVATDITGNHIQVYPNATHQLYEERLDAEGVMSVTGNLGGEELESFENDE